MQHIVNISDAKVSGSASDTIITYSLGSCIGVIAYDAALPVAGMLHFQLPSSSLDAARAAKAPLMFGDTGLEHLIRLMELAGSKKTRIKVKLAGGAKMFEDNATFDIGKRNHTSIRKALWQHGLFVENEDVGGNQPRTISINVASGDVVMKRGGESFSL